MARKKRRGHNRNRGRTIEKELEQGRIGEILLDIHRGIHLVERGRRALTRYGLSHRRWLEIVRDIDPNFRFMARPQEMDNIVTYLESVGEPVKKRQLVNEMAGRGVGTLERIRQVIRINLKTGKLKEFPENQIGLPEKAEKPHH
jgi:hypothetical protein